MSARPGLVLMGFGGHARSVADVALTAGYAQLLFVDDKAKEDESFLTFPVRRVMPLEAGDWVYMPCAGDNRRRFGQIRDLGAAKLSVATIISPLATIGHGAIVSPGCFVGHHAHIGPLARLGGGCIVNTGAVVEHDCVLGECVHVSVQSGVAGRSKLGDRVFLGIGSVVIDGVSLASDVIVGAGGVVVSAIESEGVYAGIPARRISNLNSA